MKTIHYYIMTYSHFFVFPTAEVRVYSLCIFIGYQVAAKSQEKYFYFNVF